LFTALAWVAEYSAMSSYRDVALLGDGVVADATHSVAKNAPDDELFCFCEDMPTVQHDFTADVAALAAKRAPALRVHRPLKLTTVDSPKPPTRRLSVPSPLAAMHIPHPVSQPFMGGLLGGACW
jgi:hypothetical protein